MFEHVMEDGSRNQRRNKKRSKNQANSDTEEGYEFSTTTSRDKRNEDVPQFEDRPSKRRKTENTNWLPIANPINERIDKNIRDYEKTHCECKDKNRFCFACDTTGYNLPYFSGTQVQELLIYMYNEISTASMDSHCISVYEKFEHTVRKPINNDILRHRSTSNSDDFELIPEWLPSVIKEHIESHHIDPEVQMQLLVKDFLAISRQIRDSCLFKKTIIKIPKTTQNIQAVTDTRNLNVSVDAMEERVPDAQEETQQPSPVEEYDEIEDIQIDHDNLKAYKDTIDIAMKIYKSNPQKMLPFYTKDKFVVEQRAAHPFFHLNSKKIVTDTPFNSAKDRGFRM